jgi:hypothetical protein
MKNIHEQSSPLTELDDDDRMYIMDLFHQEIVPKLKKLNARLGTLNCEFAGDKYKKWNIEFRSIGSDFDIVKFEYDEEGVGVDLDL